MADPILFVPLRVKYETIKNSQGDNTQKIEKYKVLSKKINDLCSNKTSEVKPQVDKIRTRLEGLVEQIEDDITKLESQEKPNRGDTKKESSSSVKEESKSQAKNTQKIKLKPSPFSSNSNLKRSTSVPSGHSQRTDSVTVGKDNAQSPLRRTKSEADIGTVDTSWAKDIKNIESKFSGIAAAARKVDVLNLEDVEKFFYNHAITFLAEVEKLVNKHRTKVEALLGDKYGSFQKSIRSVSKEAFINKFKGVLKALYASVQRGADTQYYNNYEFVILQVHDLLSLQLNVRDIFKPIIQKNPLFSEMFNNYLKMGIKEAENLQTRYKAIPKLTVIDKLNHLSKGDLEQKIDAMDQADSVAISTEEENVALVEFNSAEANSILNQIQDASIPTFNVQMEKLKKFLGTFGDIGQFKGAYQLCNPMPESVKLSSHIHKLLKDENIKSKVLMSSAFCVRDMGKLGLAINVMSINYGEVLEHCSNLLKYYLPALLEKALGAVDDFEERFSKFYKDAYNTLLKQFQRIKKIFEKAVKEQEADDKLINDLAGIKDKDEKFAKLYKNAIFNDTGILSNDASVKRYINLVIQTHKGTQFYDQLKTALDEFWGRYLAAFNPNTVINNSFTDLKNKLKKANQQLIKKSGKLTKIIENLEKKTPRK